MTQLIWDEVGTREFESGIEKGVLYTPDTNGVYPWSGLISVEETSTSDAGETLYYDGATIYTPTASSPFSGTLSAFTYPDIFMKYSGYRDLVAGVRASNQPKLPFNLSYQTRVGNDLDGESAGYKIHIHYGLMATPQQNAYTTSSATLSPMIFKWNLQGSLQEARGIGRTIGDIVIDSRRINPSVLDGLNDILYGTDVVNPSLPSLDEMIDLLIDGDGDLIIITDNGDGTWTATGPDALIIMLDSTTFQISDIEAWNVYDDSYTISTF